MSYVKTFAIIMSLMTISCTQANETTDKPTDVKAISQDELIRLCTQGPWAIYHINPAENVMVIPTTPTEKKRENLKGTIMSGELLKTRLEKYHLEEWFDADTDNNRQVEQNDGDARLYYYSRTNKNSLGFLMKKGFLLQYFDYYLNSYQKSSHQLSPTDKQEILTLINIITDNPDKSKEILSELEKIYQDKLDKKETLANDSNDDIVADYNIVANIEYQGILFELGGSHYIDPKKTECNVIGLSYFSAT